MVIAEASDLLKFGVGAKHDFLTQLIEKEPVRVVGTSVVFSPQGMELNKFYLAELNGEPYMYRRVSDGEVEVYGLAD